MRHHLVLASASPRRRELLAGLGIEVEIRPADIDETPLSGEAPLAYVERLAREKACAVATDSPGEVVLGADTTVELDGQIFGKPDDDDQARMMLRRLAGRTHQVHTGVALVVGGLIDAQVCSTSVTLASLSEAMIDWYVSTGESIDKAGAYALQAVGGAFVTRVTGSVTNVIGLPLDVVVRLAERKKIEIFPWQTRRFGDD